MKRGDVVLVPAPGDFGKPRPAVVVQCDQLNATHSSVLVCLMTSHLLDAPFYRLTADATEETGLRLPSQIMADRILALRRERIGRTIGHLGPATLQRLNRSLSSSWA